MHMYEYVFHKFYNSQISISQVYNSQILAHERSLEKVINNYLFFDDFYQFL